jgi:hypothetical protein
MSPTGTRNSTPTPSSPSISRSPTFERINQGNRIVNLSLFPHIPERPTTAEVADDATVIESAESSPSTRDNYATSISVPPCNLVSQTPRFRTNGDKSVPIELATMGGVFPRMISTNVGPVSPPLKDLESGLHTRVKKIRQLTVVKIIIEIAKSSRTNVLLILVPVGIALYYIARVHPIASFIVNILAMIPLAGVTPQMIMLNVVT